MKKLLLKLVTIFIFTAITSGCASMFGDNTRQVTVKSHPNGAKVYVDGLNYGTTPTVITLPTYIYGGKTITMKKNGYQDTHVIINSKFQLVGLWNILTTWGFGVDLITGNFVKIDPAQLNIDVDMSSN